MLLYAILPDGREREFMINEAVEVPENANLELRWPMENEKARSFVRVDSKLLRITGSHVVIGQAREFGNSLYVTELDASGKIISRGMWNLTLQASVECPPSESSMKSDHSDKKMVDADAYTPNTDVSCSPTREISEETLKALKAETDALRKEKAKLESELETTREDKASLDREIADLKVQKDKLSNLEDGIRSLSGEISSCELEIDDKKALLEKKHRDSAAMDTELTEADEALRQKQNSLEDLRRRDTDVDKALAELAEMREKLGLKDKERESALAELKQVTEACEQAAREVTDKEKKLAEETERSKALDEKLIQLKGDCQRADADVKQLSAQLERLESLRDEELARIKDKMNKLYEAVGQSQKLWEEIPRNIDVVLESLNDDAIAERFGEIEECRGELSKLQRRSVEIRAKVVRIVSARIVD